MQIYHSMAIDQIKVRTTVGKGLVWVLDHPKDYGKLFSSRINRNMDNDKFWVLGSGLSTQHPKTTLNTRKYPLNKQLNNNFIRKPKSGKLRTTTNRMKTGQSRQPDNKTHHQSTWNQFIMRHENKAVEVGKHEPHAIDSDRSSEIGILY